MFDVQSKPGIEAVKLIKMDTLTYGVSYEVSGIDSVKFPSETFSTFYDQRGCTVARAET